MSIKKILFIKLLNSSFINIDEEILSDKYKVVTFKFNNVKGIHIVMELFSEFFFMLKHIWNTDIIYIWFADFHAVIPTIIGRLFRKKVVIVIGGVDASYVEEFNYGVKTKLLGRISLYLSTKYATKLLPVTKFTYNSLLNNVSPRLSTKSTIIYNCYNNLFNCTNDNKRNRNVVTVCLANTKVTTLMKGVDYYVSLAKELPELTFYVVGVDGQALEYLESISAENVVLLPKIPQQELKDLFCKSKVICQFSRHEAFGVALLEGISSGCYPIGYNYGGTKEILIDDLGILIDKLDVNDGKRAIELGIEKTQTDILLIKESVDKRFMIDVRKRKLISFIDAL